MIVQQDLIELCNAAGNAGHIIDPADLQLLTWNAGLATHDPIGLPLGFSAIYIFKSLNEYLKVGQAGQNSGPRYLSQHYYTTSPSSLAKSLINDQEYSVIIGNQIPRDWIRTNTWRFNILIPLTYSRHFVNFAEAFFILKCNPRFEK